MHREPEPPRDPIAETQDVDDIRATLIARGALRNPLHWDQLLRDTRRDATCGAEYITTLRAKAEALPSSK